MRKTYLVVICVLLLTILNLTTSSAWAVPNLINYQGKLADPNGVAQNGDFQMSFSLYTTTTGGTSLWNETQTVTVDNGVYSVQLGKVSSLKIELFDNDSLYLEVEIDGEILSPRQRITSTAYAIKAASLDINSITSNMITDNSITGNKISDGAVGTSDLADNSVTSAKIVDGTIQQTDLSFRPSDGYSLDAYDGDPKDMVYVADNGNVGIGTTNPQLTLDVRGAITTSDSIELTAQRSGNRYSYIDFHGDDTYEDYGLRIIRFQTGKDAESQIHHRGSGILHLCTLEEGSHIVLNPPYGNVGIGTATPITKLHVVGDFTMTGGIGLTRRIFVDCGDLEFKTGAEGDDGDIRVELSRGNRFAIRDGTKDLFTVHYNGNISIGTMGPEEKLTVAGNLQTTGLNVGHSGDQLFDIQATQSIVDTDSPTRYRAFATDGPTIGVQALNVDYLMHLWIECSPSDGYLKRSSGSNLYIGTQEVSTLASPGPFYNQMTITKWGNVGIGTTDPDSRLEIKAKNKDSSGGLRITSNINDNSVIILQDSKSGDQGLISIRAGGSNRIGLRANGHTYFNGGNVGIGTTIPQERLDVAGNVRCQVLTITGGADLAEPFNVKDKDIIKPGMVLIIDPENPGQLKISEKAYDHCVAGIVSGAGKINPGMIMGQSATDADGDYPVALSGRVYCMADASNGSIRPGDLMTTSETPGHAMRVTDYSRAQGAVVGKAMSSLESGKGLILVLVTLQ